MFQLWYALMRLYREAKSFLLLSIVTLTALNQPAAGQKMELVATPSYSATYIPLKWPAFVLDPQLKYIATVRADLRSVDVNKWVCIRPVDF